LANTQVGNRASFVTALPTTGHSQRVVSAIAIAASTTIESFTQNAKKAVRWLFFCGLRARDAFPVLSLGRSVVDDSVKGGEGVPSPMLAVTGLSLKHLEPHIKKTNVHLLANSQLHTSLHNGSCVIWTCHELEGN
jgi:fatty acid synthase subunit beta